MRLILTGATGFAGGEVLRQALADASVSQVAVLARRPSGAAHPKLREIILSDFLDYSSVDLRGYDACVWCLGVSQSAVDEAQYVKITCDYTLSAATAMFSANPEFRFCFVSGRGADPEEQSKRLFGRIKGRTERKLAELNAHAFIFRPGYIRPTVRSGSRKDAARFFAPLGKLIDLFVDDFGVDCDQLARCLLDVAKGRDAPHLLNNRDISNWT
jgi:uncharacterized protein YbjT (DUF2867 family)